MENIGPIDQLSVELPFDENGNPKPIIFVGENGSGKTILQSQIIDSFYEIGSGLFDDVGKTDGLSKNYYKMSGGLNLQSGKNKGFSALVFINEEKNKIEYLDIMGDVKKEDVVKLIPDFVLSPNNKDGNQKVTTSIKKEQKKNLQAEWLSGVHFYQPAYRYEEPFWKNKQFFDYQRFEEKRRFSNQLGKDIEIIVATKDNKSYLLDLVLDFTRNSSKNSQGTLDQEIWKNLNEILRKVKRRDDVRFGIGPRGGYRVSIVEQDLRGEAIRQLIPSIDNLSLGESVLLNLFINIIRHGDNPPKACNEIKGIVAIDEIDVHLHTDLQNLVLPELINLFPKVQFIFTTHSPLFLLGMKKVFGEEGFEVRSMPDGRIITTERFSEFEKAYEVLKETEKYESEIKKKTEDVEIPILFVEGDHDIKYINKAAELLSKQSILKKVKIFDANGYGGLDKIWIHYNTKLSEIVPQKILLLYDCDTNKSSAEKGKVFKRAIPTVSTNLIKNGIENLFPEKTIKKAQDYKKAFIDYTPEVKKLIRAEEKIEEEKYEVNKQEKTNLCDWLCDNGDKEDFKNFSSIMKIIESILSEDKEVSGD